jgi:dolichol-phosphate mannosyltransferase
VRLSTQPAFVPGSFAREEDARGRAPWRVVVVVPTFQEAENVVELLRRVRAAVPYADVLVVDDASPDGTADLAETVGRELGGGVSTLRRPGKAGLGAAYRAGFEAALARGYDVIVQMDADLSHDPAALPVMLRRLAAGADLVIGSRYVPGGSTPDWPLRRRLLSRLGNAYVCTMLRLPVRDATSGFRAIRRSLVDAIGYHSMEARGYGFLIEETYRAAVWTGGSVAEVPIAFGDRRHGRSKISKQIVAEALWLVARWGIRDHLRGRGVRDHDEVRAAVT